MPFNDNEITVFGQKAEGIEDGQIFEAKVSSVEGRKKVTLIATGFDQRGAKKN